MWYELIQFLNMSKHDEIHKIWVNGTHNSLTTKLFLGPLRRASGQKPPIFSYDNLTSFSQIGTKYATRLTLCIGHDATSFAVLGSINMVCSATFKEDLATITLCNKSWLCVYFVCAVTVWFLYHNRSHSFLYIPVGTWMWLLNRKSCTLVILSKKVKYSKWGSNYEV